MMSRIGCFVMAAVLSLAGAAGAMAETGDRDVVEDFYTELLSKAGREDLDEAAEKVLVENWVSVPTPRGGPDRSGLVATLQGFAQAVPDLNWEPQEILQDGNRFTVRSVATGTPTAEFFGVAPTGKSFEIMTIDIHTVEDGRIVSSFHVEDWVRAIGQLSAE